MNIPELDQRVEAFVESRKLVGFTGKTLRQDVKTILEAADQVNSCTELENSVGGESLDDAKLPSWVAPLIYPTKVSVLPGFFFPDLVERPIKMQDWKFDIAVITSASYRIAQLFKTAPEMASAREMRGTEAVLSNVHFVVNGWVRQDGDELFFPVPLRPESASVLGNEWGNMQVDRMIDLFFARKFKMSNR